MKRILLLFLLLVIPVIAQAQTLQPPPDPFYLHGGIGNVATTPAVATGNGASAPVAYYGGAVIQIINSAGTFAITFEGTLDGTNYVAILATNLSSGAQATTAAAAGLYSVYAPGFQRIRARISACSSCATTATERPVVAYISRTPPAGSSGTVTDVSIVTANGVSGSVANSTSTPQITLTIQNAAADGSTKGIASFNASDFDASGGNISIDYANALSADATHKGLLSAADWSIFNAKQASLGFTPENVANKDTDVNLAANSDVKYASQKAVKSYVDSGLAGKQAAGSYVTGTLTPGTVPVATGPGALGNSRITDNGTNIGIATDGSLLLFQLGDNNTQGFFKLDLDSQQINLTTGITNNSSTLYLEDNFSANLTGKVVSLYGLGPDPAEIEVDTTTRSVTIVGNHIFDKTITASGTTGAQTINLVTGAVNFAAAATSLVVTNSLVDANSVVTCTVGTNDTTMKSVACVVASGSFTIYPNAAPTAETRVYFRVSN